MKVLFMGPQGSGKSTQASLLAQDLGFPYIQVGEVFRTVALLEDSQTAKIVKEAVDNGKLVPLEIATFLINKRLSQTDCLGGFIMDGYPRNYEQFKPLDIKLDKVYYILVSDEEGIKRLLKRGRSDDTRDVIAQRLSIYHQETEPLLKSFREQEILEEIDGERPISEIHDDILARVKANDIH